MKRTILKLQHDEKPDLFIVVNGGVAEAYDIAQTYKVKNYVMKEAVPARICIFQNEKCPIISEHLNYYTIFHNQQELAVTSTQIEIL
jgi:hypothetical protein